MNTQEILYLKNLEVLAERDRLREANRELLAALKATAYDSECYCLGPGEGGPVGGVCAFCGARAAIAKHGEGK